MATNFYIKYIVFIILLIGDLNPAKAQEPTFSKYGAIDRQVKKVPDSLSNNIIHLHRYLDSIGVDDEERIRAFYMWIITNIKYENQVELLFDKNLLFYMGSNNSVSPVSVLMKRKAVCEGFSRLFQFFCQQSGIEAYTIGGYISKKGAFQDRATHSWNVVKVNDEWRFFDLTWAYASFEHTGIKSSTNEFYMVKPQEFILSHLPLVPMWQFLETPVPISIFNMGDDMINDYLIKKKTHYSYEDSLKTYMQLGVRERCLKTADEIYKTNSSNKFNRAIEYLRYARVILSFQNTLEKKELKELLEAKDKIKKAMLLFRETQDVSAQLMFLQALDNLLLLEKWIQITQSQK
ncbi:transglutaminase domain-containing protein [Ancylomarina sp.]|uniref:transglutaminase domain-containing protein n=1 Tax=Ancylomarina sp. TaxID=1970196 RepID=UPI003568EA52